jgi:hypothetical protein
MALTSPKGTPFETMRAFSGSTRPILPQTGGRPESLVCLNPAAAPWPAASVGQNAKNSHRGQRE